MLAGMLLLLSCGKREVEIDRETRTVIDTIAAKEIRLLNEELDSLCTAKFDRMVLQVLDSILAVREREVQSYIKE